MTDDVQAHAITVALSGEYDIARTADLRDAVLGMHAGEPEVRLDLAEVTFMDSTALRALLEVRSELERRGATITIVRPTPTLVRLFDISGTGELFGLPPAPAPPG